MVQPLFDDDFVEVAPHPIFTRLQGSDNRMLRRVKVLGGVFVLGRIATADVAAFQAQPQMDPGIAHLEAFFTTGRLGLDRM
jgi:hypothetical protein